MDIKKIKQLRFQTGISLGECKNALEQTQGDLDKAKEILRKKGAEFAAKKQQRQAKAGIIHSYIHSNAKVGVLLDLKCETDFVVRNDNFKKLAHEICMQIAATDPENKDMLLNEAWIKDAGKTINDLVSEHIAKLGENIVLEKFTRYEI
ncbi:MAG: translation elongation factor Ts [Candidatus Pacebacteria bacterium]|nr:translation elongation factor Ts [Candidatus Paceibacterota bacterium]